MAQNRKRWAPDAEQLKTLELMSGLGMSEAHMADEMGVSLSTFQLAEKKSDALRKCLSKGRNKALMRVARTAYEMAISGKEPAMTIFLCKTRLRWKEPPASLEHSGPNGEPLQTNTPQVIVTIPDNGRAAKK